MGNKEEELGANRADSLCTGIWEKADKADVAVCYRLPNQDGGADEIFTEQCQSFALVLMGNFH